MDNKPQSWNFWKASGCRRLLLAFCDYSGIAYKIDVLALVTQEHRSTMYCTCIIHCWWSDDATWCLRHLLGRSFRGAIDILWHYSSQIFEICRRWVIADGNGNEPKPFKAEWAVIKAGCPVKMIHLVNLTLMTHELLQLELVRTIMFGWALLALNGMARVVRSCSLSKMRCCNALAATVQLGWSKNRLTNLCK